MFRYFVHFTSDSINLVLNCLELSFWKQNSRKIYAVAGPGDDDEHQPKKAKTEMLSHHSDGKLLRQLDSIHLKLDALFEVKKSTKVPIGLLCALRATFQCMICAGMIVPPIMMSQCCHSIIGCKSCIDLWFRTPGTEGDDDILDKSCPKCKAERGYSNIHKLLGFDELLAILGGLEDTEGPSEDTGSR